MITENFDASELDGGWPKDKTLAESDLFRLGTIEDMRRKRYIEGWPLLFCYFRSQEMYEYARRPLEQARC